MEASEAALDMRVIRAGHDKIPLARIERRSSEAEQRSSGVIRDHQGSSESEQSPGESIMKTCANMLQTQWGGVVSVIQHYQQTGLCWSWQLFIENLQAVSLILIS